MPGNQEYWNSEYERERLQVMRVTQKRNVNNRLSQYAYYQALRKLLVIYSDANAWSTTLAKVGRFFKGTGGRYADKIAKFLKDQGHMRITSVNQELSDDYDKPEATIKLLVSAIADLLDGEKLDPNDDLYKILKAATDKAQCSYMMDNSFAIDKVEENGFTLFG